MRVNVTVDLDAERVDVEAVAVWDVDDDGPVLECVQVDGEPVALDARQLARVHQAVGQAFQLWADGQRQRWADERAEAIAEDRAFWRDRDTWGGQ